jgi:choline-sulfatase
MPQQPNLLYIHSDQHNPAVTGCYGDPLVRTPNLDQLAREGVTFDSTYCPSPICTPSRMSMLTGRHPYQNQVWTNTHVLDSGLPTFAHSMGAGGYRPVLVGRMHSNGPDQLHGYAQRLIGDHGPNHTGGIGVDHGELTGTAGPFRVSLEKSGHGQSAYQVHDEDVVTATVDYLNQLGSQRRGGDGDEPFNLSVGLMLPHQPFVARREDYEYYFENMTPPQTPEPMSDKIHPYIREWRERCEIIEVTPEETRRARAAYWALTARMDIMIGQILQALRDNDLADNTLIIYSSDHGEQVGEHGLWWKQTFYEDSIRVPLIMSWPGRLPQGTRCDRVISQLDLNATMLDALDCPPLPNSPGRSLLPLLADADSPWEDVAYSEFCLDLAGAGGPFPEDGVRQRMVRRGPWKLIYHHGYPCQLFNLEEDPKELVDHSQDESCTEIVAALTAEVIDGWDPDTIALQMARMRADGSILKDWASKTTPTDQYRWDLRPEMDFLDPEQMK